MGRPALMKNDTGSQENENNCYDPRDAVDFYSHIGPEAKRFCRADALFDEKTDKKTKKKAIILKNRQFFTSPLARLA